MRKVKIHYKGIFAGIVIAALLSTSAIAQDSGQEHARTALTDLLQLSIDELMNIEVTSVSKKEERLAETASAVYVITGEDIRRSGVTSIPEALRMAPGLQVARISSNTWAISSRGFNKRFSNKLLVLMDGRTIYTPIFSGVLWHTKDTMLEDIERIEVIRGPGAALWGANAVNGVINIITKKAGNTEGGLVSGGAGTEERGFGALRYGGKLGEDTSYRGYVKYFSRDDFVLSSGERPSNDKWISIQGGFRMDGKRDNMNSFTLQGDIYNGSSGDMEDIFVPFSPYRVRSDVNIKFNGGNILGRWRHRHSDTSDMQLQLYYDHTEDRFDFLDSMRALVRTYDIDFQHRLKLSDKQDLTYGIGYRYISDDINSVSNISYNPQTRATQLYSAFIHDEITLITNSLKLIISSRFEHNDYTGFEIQPNGHILWTPAKKHTVWGAISRAVRTPSRINHNMKSFYSGLLPIGKLFSGSPPALYSMSGTGEVISEDLLSYELGYRTQPSRDLSIDIASFYNAYDNLHTYELGKITSSSTHLVIPITVDNKKYGDTYGVELSAQWQALPWWRLSASYSNLQVRMYGKNGTIDPAIHSEEGASPHNQFTLRSSQDLSMNMEMDAFIRYVDRLSTDAINSYTEMDIRIGWSPLKSLSVSIVGQNLLNGSHLEFKGEGFYIQKTEAQRGVYGKVVYKF